MENKQKEIAGVQSYYSFINQYKNQNKNSKKHGHNNHKQQPHNKLTSYGDTYIKDNTEYEN